MKTWVDGCRTRQTWVNVRADGGGCVGRRIERPMFKLELHH